MTIYLDHAATAPPLPEALDVFQEVAATQYANPGSLHQSGVTAAVELRKWRNRLLGAFGLDDWQVVLTASGTESDHLGVCGMAHAIGGHPTCKPKSPYRILIGAAEHPAVRDNATALSSAGFQIETIPVDEFGVVRPESLKPLLGENVAVVAIQWANNELGGINPISELTAMTRQFAPRASFHVDAVQAAGKIKQDLCELGAHSIAVAAHKIGGVRGCAALFISPDATTPLPVFRGGGHESGLRSATENLSGLAAFTVAAETRRQYLKENPQRYHQVRRTLFEILRSVRPDCHVLGPIYPHEVQGSILTVAFPGEMAEPLLNRLDQAGIQCGSGSACSAHGATESPILEAINLPKELRNSVLRFSFDSNENDKDLSKVAQVFKSSAG